MVQWLLGAALAVAGVMAAWSSRGKQAKAEAENKILLEAITNAKEQHRKARLARSKAIRDFDSHGISDDYKYLRKDT